MHAHNAYCYRCPFGLTYPSCDVRCAPRREGADRDHDQRPGIAGVIAEPIQGVGGFITPPKEYFPIVADIIREHGGIFIADEVQSGWGRAGGKWFGIEHYDVTPDVMSFAKGLANGLPIGPTTAKPEIADSMRYLTLSTFGGNPISTAAAKAVIDFVDEENLLDNCTEVGGYLREGLEALARQAPDHRRRERDGVDAGARAGRRSRDEGARGGSDEEGDGVRATERTAGRQGRLVRQRDSGQSADEHRQDGRGRVPRAAGFSARTMSDRGGPRSDPALTHAGSATLPGDEVS